MVYAELGTGPERIWVQCRGRAVQKLTTPAGLEIVDALASDAYAMLREKFTLQLIPLFHTDCTDKNLDYTEGDAVDLEKDWRDMNAPESLNWFALWKSFKPGLRDQPASDGLLPLHRGHADRQQLPDLHQPAAAGRIPRRSVGRQSAHRDRGGAMPCASSASIPPASGTNAGTTSTKSAIFRIRARCCRAFRTRTACSACAARCTSSCARTTARSTIPTWSASISRPRSRSSRPSRPATSIKSRWSATRSCPTASTTARTSPSGWIPAWCPSGSPGSSTTRSSSPA